MPRDTASYTVDAAGWMRNAAGELIGKQRPVVDVFAEHFMGGGRGDEPMTRLTKRALWAEGGKFLMNRAGHLSDGEIVSLSHHSDDYRVNVVAQQVAA